MSESVYRGERTGFKAVIRNKISGALHTQPDKSVPPFRWTVGRTHEKREEDGRLLLSPVTICEDGLHWCTESPLFCLEYIRPESETFKLNDFCLAVYHVECPTHLIDLTTDTETDRVNPIVRHERVSDQLFTGDFKRCSFQLTVSRPVDGFFVRPHPDLDYHGAGFKDGLLHSHPLSALTGNNSDDEWILPGVAWHRIINSSDHYMDFYHHGRPVHRLIKELFCGTGDLLLGNSQAYRSFDFFHSFEIGLDRYRVVTGPSYWFLCLHRDLFAAIVERVSKSDLPERAFHWPYLVWISDEHMAATSPDDPDLRERIVEHCRHVMMPYGSMLPRKVFQLWFQDLKACASKTPNEWYDWLLDTMSTLLSAPMIGWFRDKKSLIMTV